MKNKYIKVPVKYRTDGFYQFIKANKILVCGLLIIMLLGIAVGGFFMVRTISAGSQAEGSVQPAVTPEAVFTFTESPTPTQTQAATKTPTLRPTVVPTATPAVTPTISASPSVTPSGIKTTTVPAPTPKAGTSWENMVYLTFDDGPSQLTAPILDILKTKNVKATFFMVGNRMTYASYKEVVKRVVAEGHLIGCHSYTHKYNEIYLTGTNGLPDVSGLASQLVQFESTYEKVLGVKMEEKVFRFPAGSYYSKIKNRNYYLDELHRRGYKVYDWNVTDGDGIYSNETLKANAWSTFTGNFNDYLKRRRGRPIVILLHDMPSKQGTADILGQMIDYIRQKGFTFSTLADYPPEVLG